MNSQAECHGRIGVISKGNASSWQCISHHQTLREQNPPRPRISQGPSASSHSQHPMDPLPRPAPTASGGYMEMLQSQPQYGWGWEGGGPNTHQMVSNFLFYFFSRVFTVAIKLSVCTPSCNVCNLSFKIMKEISFLLIQR